MRRLIFTTIFALPILAGSAFAKEWRGIIPLQSTRADVERLLGKPKLKNDGAFYYDRPAEIVVVEFQAETCEGLTGGFGFGWNVSPEKVTVIGIIPKTSMTKEAAGVNADFKVEDAKAGLLYFDSDEEGLSVETFDGRVTNIRYRPTAKDDAVKCPRVQQCCIDFFPAVDEYGRLTRNDELARLLFLIKRLQLGFARCYRYSGERRDRASRANCANATHHRLSVSNAKVCHSANTCRR